MKKPKLEKKDTDLTKGERGYLTRVVNIFYDEAESILAEIKNKREQLFGATEEEVGLIGKIEEEGKKIEALKDDLEHAHFLIFEPQEEDEESLYNQMTPFVQEFRDKKKDIEIINADIKAYKDKIYGCEDEAGNKKPGIKDEIEDYVKSLNQLIETNTERQNELFERIEGLLQGASTVALAKAFNEHKNSFNKVNTKWERMFLGSIASMMIISIASFALSEFQFHEMWKYTLGNLPFLGGAIWLAIYASKQRSQNKRLQQEYAFKEDVAKIYYGLKQEVEDLGGTELGEKLNEQVLSLIVDVVALNPSETLDNKSHIDKGPVMEAISKLSEVVKSSKK